jgi:hypothetical protein
MKDDAEYNTDASKIRHRVLKNVELYDGHMLMYSSSLAVVVFFLKNQWSTTCESMTNEYIAIHIELGTLSL